jgi:hypothetical protein
MHSSLKRLGLGVLFAAVLVLAVLNVLVWSGVFVDSQEDAATRAPARPRPETIRPQPPPVTTTAARSTPTGTTAQPTQTISRIVLTASRGDCWVVARSGSGSGPLLYEGLLQTGRTVRLEAKRVWLSLGAAANVDVLIDGKHQALPEGTIEVVVPRSQS